MSTPLSVGSPLSNELGGFHLTQDEIDNLVSTHARTPITLTSTSNGIAIGDVNLSLFDITTELSTASGIELSSAFVAGSLTIAAPWSVVEIASCAIVTPSGGIDITAESLAIDTSSLLSSSGVTITLSEAVGFLYASGSNSINITASGGNVTLQSSNVSSAVSANISSPLRLTSSGDVVLSSVVMKMNGAAGLIAITRCCTFRNERSLDIAASVLSMAR